MDLNFPGDKRHQAFAVDAFKYLDEMGDNVDRDIFGFYSEKGYLSPIENFSFKAEKYVEYFPNLVEGYNSMTKNLKNSISKV